MGYFWLSDMGHEHFLTLTGRHEHFLYSTGRHEHFLNSIRTPPPPPPPVKGPINVRSLIPPPPLSHPPPPPPPRPLPPPAGRPLGPPVPARRTVRPGGPTQDDELLFHVLRFSEKGLNWKTGSGGRGVCKEVVGGRVYSLSIRRRWVWRGAETLY